MYCARFEVLAVVLLKIHVFLDVMPCSLLSIIYCYLQTEKEFTPQYDLRCQSVLYLLLLIFNQDPLDIGIEDEAPVETDASADHTLKDEVKNEIKMEEQGQTRVAADEARQQSGGVEPDFWCSLREVHKVSIFLGLCVHVLISDTTRQISRFYVWILYRNLLGK